MSNLIEQGLGALKKGKDALKTGQQVIDTPNQVIKQGEDLKKHAEGVVDQGKKAADQLNEFSGNQLTIKIGAASKDAAAIETRLAAHGFEITNKDGKIDAREAIRLEEFVKGKPGLQGEIKFDEKKNTLVFSKKALETLKAEPAAAKVQAAPAPAQQAAPAPAAQQPAQAPKAAGEEKSAMDAAKEKAAEAFKDANCAFPWKQEFKTEQCANVRKAADDKRREQEQLR